MVSKKPEKQSFLALPVLSRDLFDISIDLSIEQGEMISHPEYYCPNHYF